MRSAHAGSIAERWPSVRISDRRIFQIENSQIGLQGSKSAAPEVDLVGVM